MNRFLAWSLGLVFFADATRLAYASSVSEPKQQHFEFRMPHAAAFRIEESEVLKFSGKDKPSTLKAWPQNHSTNSVELTSRVFIQTKSTDSLPHLLAGHALSLSRSLGPNVFILQAADALMATREAHRLAALPEVETCYPVMNRQADLHGQYFSQPSDFFFPNLGAGLPVEWEMDNRNTDGSIAGFDLNVRSAWPIATGTGILIGLADSGVEMNHPELLQNVSGQPHFNFVLENTNAGPVNRFSSAAHGTEAAGLIAADLNHGRMVGVAPTARLASLVIFNSNLGLATDEQLMDAYQYQSNSMSVQNHSWGNPGLGQTPLLPSEQIGISNAVNYGRSGRGIVMIRSAGNDRTSGANCNDDGYPSDPRVITVAATRKDGRAASYSEPGACILVSAPGGDLNAGETGLFTTDLLGTDGVNSLSFFPPFDDLSGYVWNSIGFNGTSAAAPLVSGVAGLILSANTNLSYRDVQQILILSSRQVDLADPDTITNGAGLLVSHNQGFGVPDAGVAVKLARNWLNRPPMQRIIFTNSTPAAIPDDGLRLLVTGLGIPANLTSIQTLPGTGPHADAPTAMLPLVYVGLATNPIPFSLTNKAALIERGTNLSAEKINYAAQAGAAFAVIYNFRTNTSGSGAPGGDQLMPLGGTDYSPIPAVFIGNTYGEGLTNFIANSSDALAQIHLNTTNYIFNITNTLLCEHIGVRVKTDHPLRGDVRITLTSPSGTRSVLQRYNADTNAGPVDWTYYSTHHFFESSAGNWTIYFSDESQGNIGTVQQVSLIIEGVPILDSDKDGLDDNWEITHFGSLSAGPKDDPDHDGSSNMREYLAGTDPNAADVPFQLDQSELNPSTHRVSWPSSTNFTYQVWGGTNVAALNLLTNIPGHFPEMEWLAPNSSASNQFFQVRAMANP